MIKQRLKFLPISLLVILADQLTKKIAVSSLNYGEPITVVKGFFNLFLIYNPGMIWGMLSNHPNPLIPKIITAVSLAVLLLVSGLFLFSRSLQLLEKISFALIIGGALSNIADRVLHGYVIDFLDFYYKSYHWPTFNLADAAISVGIILYLIAILRSKNAPDSDKNR